MDTEEPEGDVSIFRPQGQSTSDHARHKQCDT